MSDRSGAYLFSVMFEFLASDDMLQTMPVQANKMARKLWGMMGDHDFSPYQMYCDEALGKLGLARRVPDEYNPGYTTTKYGPK